MDQREASAPISASRLSDAYAYCEDSVRAGDRDRYLATLFAPAAKRPNLFALYAFSLDVARIRDVAHQPLAGEVRLQWWRDALLGEAHGDVAAHPVAAALLDTVARFELPVEALLDLIDARSFDLYDDPMTDLGELEAYCRSTSSTLIALAASVLKGSPVAVFETPISQGGLAYAMTGLLRALPFHAHRGQVFVPADILGRHWVTRMEIVTGQDSERLHASLADMRALTWEHYLRYEDAARHMPSALRPALLPVDLAPLYLKRMQSGSYAPFRTPVEVAQWRRQWRLWRMARR